MALRGERALGSGGGRFALHILVLVYGAARSASRFVFLRWEDIVVKFVRGGIGVYPFTKLFAQIFLIFIAQVQRTPLFTMSLQHFAERLLAPSAKVTAVIARCLFVFRQEVEGLVARRWRGGSCAGAVLAYRLVPVLVRTRLVRVQRELRDGRLQVCLWRLFRRIGHGRIDQNGTCEGEQGSLMGRKKVALDFGICTKASPWNESFDN